jgi:hypothetical protein
MSPLVDLQEQLAAVAAAPKPISRLDECFFYHAMDIPGYGHVEGEWDLRGGESAYLAGVPLRGKRVLELGTADGFLTFHMERQGAEVISYDLSPDFAWDAVPFARGPRQPPSNGPADGNWVRATDSYRDRITRLNNAYWLCHRAFGSNARMVYGNVYAIPDEIGTVDVTTLGALLLHTRDPFGALASALRLTRETVIVTEPRSRLCPPAPLAWIKRVLPPPMCRPAMRFLPDWKRGAGADGWWRLSPEIVVAFLGVLGFEKTGITRHAQLYKGSQRPMFTVVGHRTVG